MRADQVGTAPPRDDLALGALLSRRWVLLLLGLAFGLVMVLRSQVSGDQLNMLARGWLLTHGQWVQYGMTTSANGKSPGGLIAVLAGLPLLLWHDYRAPALFILLGHVFAFAVIDRTVRRIVTPRERLLFAVIYWLGPWQLLFAGFLWNANWLAVLSAIHLSTAYVQRERATFWASFAHVLALGLFLQIHLSAVTLIIASALLLSRRWMRLHWGGVATAVACGAASLLPWLSAVRANQGLLPGGKGFPLRGLLVIYPLLRGAFYWVRLPSLQLDGTMTSYDFTNIVGPEANRALAPALHGAALVIGAVSLVLPLLATVWLLRRGWRQRFRRDLPISGRAWLARYVVVVLVAALASFALSPTTIMAWQCFPVLPAATLAIVLWLGAVLRTRRATLVRRLVPWWFAAEIALLALSVAGSPMYRRGGAGATAIAVQRDHPMFHDLGVLAHTSVTIDPKSPWMPDVFRADPAQGR
jgi:hypothetical protein